MCRPAEWAPNPQVAVGAWLQGWEQFLLAVVEAMPQRHNLQSSQDLFQKMLTQELYSWVIVLRSSYRQGIQA
ncbi:hypothetical protein BAE29_07200 [Acidithiobacillus caldus]|uniref:Uncharacterized protein n=1 Tax=Acidithiobacillus caldus TaxID=33059 RepID=A0A1E7YKU9_9PROT|nr:hypothetical protein BAE27_11095 [Acidithiobacillus caldus]OFC32542.1 hypothetical protein BAE28_12280 [Acidithiobacillus caldus]OFC39582.1 hypothetical protein BAE29_07200 [Acidithiobacillus caldus]